MLIMCGLATVCVTLQLPTEMALDISLASANVGCVRMVWVGGAGCKTAH